MAEIQIDFLGWRRPGAFSAVTGPVLTPEGRLSGQVDVTLRNSESPGDQVTDTLRFDLMGPGDIGGLMSGAVRHMVPSPDTPDFEETACAYVELGSAELPWLYSPRLPSGRALVPWLVLVTGTVEEIAIQPGGMVILSGGALSEHPLDESARWVHVHDDLAGRSVARLLSPRNLLPSNEYLAVLVPAFTTTGQPAWGRGTATISRQLLHSWAFATSEEGDFPTLAARLKPAVSQAALGRAPTGYAPLPDLEPQPARGALAPIGSADTIVPTEISDDMSLLTAPLVDPRRPVIALPDYGDCWVPDTTATTWSRAFHADPRHRSAAGLGGKNAIDEQDLISAAASAQSGALDLASARVRDLTAGLAAAGALWQRRLPTDDVRALSLLGPGMRRLMTPAGPAVQQICGPGRPLPAALFSTAARRVLRSGPPRTSLSAPRAADPAQVLVSANSCPKPPPRAPQGLPHGDGLKDLGLPALDDLLRRFAEDPEPGFEGLRDLVAAFDRSPYEPGTVAFFDQVMEGWINRAEKGQVIPLADILAILEYEGDPLSDTQLRRALGRLKASDHDADRDSLVDLVKELETSEVDRPCRPVDLGALSTAVKNAYDPTGPHPFVVDRVLGTIDGLDDQPLTPPELCPDLDIPGWQLLRDHDPDWLLPGAGTMPLDQAVAMQTNPTFVEAYLLGINTQTIGELRFRNIPIRTGCTPMRQFWSRADPAADRWVDDIVGVHSWAPSSALGDPSHQTAAAAGSDLVLVFRTPLFRRYPRTLVYLAPAPFAGGEPDWEADPDLTNRLMPAFQGALTPEIVFFGFDLDPALGRKYWVVLEEPPHGVQFRSGPAPGMSATHVAVFTHPAAHPDGAEFADAAYADPYRVLIRGSSLIGVIA